MHNLSLSEQLLQQPFFVFDCQTTGNNASQAYVIEAAWGLYHARLAPDDWPIISHQIRLPEGFTIPKHVQRLTGITDPEANAIGYDEMIAQFFGDWQAAGNPPFLIHYAQFERPFLLKMAQSFGCLTELEATPIICTHKLSKVCYPNLRSYSLRAVAGYVSHSVQEMKRSHQHLQATAHIWQEITAVLAEGSQDSNSLMEWLQNLKPAGKSPQSFASMIDTQDRLKIPQSPGVYRMLSHKGEILYVGKAKNLKARVNSYFRGRGSKGSRINELLTRVADIRYDSYESELEALLRENDAIKDWDPPYNRALKARHRELNSLDLASLSERLSEQHLDTLDFPFLLGPVSHAWAQEFLNLLGTYLGQNTYGDIFWGRELPDGLLKAALDQLAATTGFDTERPSVHQFCQMIGSHGQASLERRYQAQLARFESIQAGQIDETEGDLADDDQEIEDEDKELDPFWTLEDLVSATARLLGSIGYQCYRSKWRHRLLNCSADWIDKEPLAIQLHGGDYQFVNPELVAAVRLSSAQSSYQERQRLIDVKVYDRLNLLYSYWRQLVVRGGKICLRLGPRHSLDEAACLKYLV